MNIAVHILYITENAAPAPAGHVDYRDNAAGLELVVRVIADKLIGASGANTFHIIVPR